MFKTWATKQGSPPALQPFSLSHPSVWSGPFQLEQYSIASPNCLKSFPFNSPKRPLSTVFLEHSSSGGSESRGCPLSHSHITSTSFTSPFSKFTSPPELHLALRHSHGYPTHPPTQSPITFTFLLHLHLLSWTPCLTPLLWLPKSPSHLRPSFADSAPHSLKYTALKSQKHSQSLESISL